MQSVPLSRWNELLCGPEKVTFASGIFIPENGDTVVSSNSKKSFTL